MGDRLPLAVFSPFSSSDSFLLNNIQLSCNFYLPRNAFSRPEHPEMRSAFAKYQWTLTGETFALEKCWFRPNGKHSLIGDNVELEAEKRASAHSGAGSSHRINRRYERIRRMHCAHSRFRIIQIYSYITKMNPSIIRSELTFQNIRMNNIIPKQYFSSFFCHQRPDIGSCWTWSGNVPSRSISNSEHFLKWTFPIIAE